MQLDVDRSDLHHIRAIARPSAPLGPDQARLRIDAFGLSANNITYAVFGDLMRYWDCFPGGAEEGVDWGRMPVWGFADVIESSTRGVDEGSRVYGYFPLADELVISPGRIDDTGFSDTAPDREAIPSVYARYALTTTDRAYRREREDQHMLLWPLFVTSFVVDDFLGDHDMYGAGTAIVTSASSKTAIGASFLLAERPGLEVVGLTSPANVEFVRSLGCYSSVLAYEAIDELAATPSAYVDVAGRKDVTHAVHTHLADNLRYSMVVGDTHWDNTSSGEGALPGPAPEFLFAPTQITKRRSDWGRDGFEVAVSAAWNRFVPWTDGWLTIRHASGPEAVEAVYRSVLDGRVDPSIGDICTLAGS
jgi:Protein of unknown function (DUF2855)